MKSKGSRFGAQPKIKVPQAAQKGDGRRTGSPPTHEQDFGRTIRDDTGEREWGAQRIATRRGGWAGFTHTTGKAKGKWKEHEVEKFFCAQSRAQCCAMERCLRSHEVPKELLKGVPMSSETASATIRAPWPLVARPPPTRAAASLASARSVSLRPTRASAAGARTARSACRPS